MGKLAPQNPMVHRKHCTPQVFGWVYNKNCWHLDVFLYYDTFSNLYIKAATSIAGTTVIGEVWFTLARDDVFGIYQLVPIEPPSELNYLKEGVLNMPSIRKALGSDWHAQDVFWRLLAPLQTLWPRGEYRRRSVAFHMVKPLGVDDPCEGIQNDYEHTGRAVRDATQGAKTRGNPRMTRNPKLPLTGMGAAVPEYETNPLGEFAALLGPANGG
jgi:hypothetical protein